MSEQAEQTPSLAVGHYLTVLRRRWRVVVVTMLVGTLAAFAYLRLGAQDATASTAVNVNVISTEPFGSSRSAAELLDSATEQEIATSSTVAELASEQLSSDVTATELRSGLEVALLSDATVLRIEYTAGDAGSARSGADAIATAYLEYRTERAEARKQKNIDNLTDRLQELRGDLRDANSRLNSANPGTPAYTRADSDRQLATIEIDGIVTQISQIQQIDTESGTVLTSAEDNDVAYTPRSYLIVATGVLGGLALGLVAAFAVNTLDRRVRDKNDVEGAGAGQIVARLHGRSGSVPATGQDLDALRVARERLLASVGPEQRVLALIDETQGRAPSDVPVNLAVVYTELARRVELILPESPSDHVVELKRALDLRSLRDDDLGQTLGSSKLNGLDVYLPHPDTAAIDDDTTGAVRSVVGEQRGADQFTIIALPPTASPANRLAAARIADAVVMVVEETRTKIDDIAQVVAEAAEVGSRVLGVVIVPPGRVTAPATVDADEPADNDSIGVRG